MIVKAIYKDKNHDYFRDKETKDKRTFGEIFECGDELAKERIKKKFVVKATKEEIKEYQDALQGLTVTGANDDITLEAPIEQNTSTEETNTPTELDNPSNQDDKDDSNDSSLEE